MIEYQKRFHLAASVLMVTYLLMKNINVAIELISKVVNYGNRVRKFPVFIFKKRKEDICSEPV